MKKAARSTTFPVIIVSISVCTDYIEAAGIADDVDGYLFRSARRKTGQLTTNPLFQQDAHRIIRRRAKAAGIETRIGNHTFRATGITASLKNSGKLEVTQQIATMNRRGRPSFTTADRMRFRLTKSSESRFKKAGCQDSGSLRNVDPGPPERFEYSRASVRTAFF